MNDTIQAYPFLDVTLSANLGDGDDTVHVQGLPGRQIRLSFTSAEVGNGIAMDSGLLVNQDGGLAVRMQAEDMADMPMGPVSWFDDESIRFEAKGGATFDIRDLVSGVARGDGFRTAILGTAQADAIDLSAERVSAYVNAGQGNDTITGTRVADFLVGGAGDDMLSGGIGNDSFIGGGGADVIYGGTGADLAIWNAATDGADRVDLGAGRDTVQVGAPAGSQLRLIFTSAEVGNGNADDSGVLANQDGGLAVRLALEDAAGEPGASVARFDDEGIRFVAAPGASFDVRDLVAGTQRGDHFGTAVLGTVGDDRVAERGAMTAVYANAGGGNDTVIGGTGDDFLVGGGGNDRLVGGAGSDSLLGGLGDDTAVLSLRQPGADMIDLGVGMDQVEVSGAGARQVRVTFTSAEVGNGSANDGGMLANQDGGLAMRLSLEKANGSLTATTHRLDDEGIRLVSTDGATFDVRDLVSGAARGDAFGVVALGTQGADSLDESASAEAVYINAGQGDDMVRGGKGADFLVGGAGADWIWGNGGADTLLGGGGDDWLTGGAGADVVLFTGGDGMDTITDFRSGTDRIDLRPMGLVPGAVMQVQLADGLRLDIDRDSDGMADSSILLSGVDWLAADDLWM